ncbi:MAG TPA: nucleoside diphosphate kinase regulator [Burkholderiales bacterium]|nr:nucleoside diphosphate kinase regulator [Burkholderiales bacterium]
MIWLTEVDYVRLRQLLAELERQSRGMRAGAETLEEILDSARIVEPERVPQNVVTMNSQVVFEDAADGKRSTVAVVYPSDVDPAAGKISVLSPMGAALIGETDGRELELPLPYGKSRRIRIVDVVYQPEAQGEFAL